VERKGQKKTGRGEICGGGVIRMGKASMKLGKKGLIELFSFFFFSLLG
jgi:hypothetical protein